MICSMAPIANFHVAKLTVPTNNEREWEEKRGRLLDFAICDTG